MLLHEGLERVAKEVFGQLGKVDPSVEKPDVKKVIGGATKEEPKNIGSVIRLRGGKTRFGYDDIKEYNWKATYYIYGRGHYVGRMDFAGRATAGSVPILYTDDETWSAPVYRHVTRIRELFIPGLAYGVPDRNITLYEYYPLADEEKWGLRQKLYREFDARLRREAEALHDVYHNLFDSKQAAMKPLGQLIFLFGTELYKGEDPETFREKRRRASKPVTIEIYPPNGLW